MSVASNNAYVKELMGKITRAVDITAQTVVEQTLAWVVSGTVQDSGNASFFWNVGIGGERLPAAILKDTGGSFVGDTGDARQPLENVEPSRGLSGLSRDASITFSAVMNRYREGAKNKIVFNGGKYPEISIHNTIDELSIDSVKFYIDNAFFLVALKEGEVFGAQRGEELAVNLTGVKNVLVAG